jgi:hypothetical protein
VSDDYSILMNGISYRLFLQQVGSFLDNRAKESTSAQQTIDNELNKLPEQRTIMSSFQYK